MAKRPRRRVGTTLAVASALLVVAAGCAEPEQSSRSTPVFARSYPLPDGLTQAPGTKPIGRPATFPAPYYDGADEVDDTSLAAAYEVDEQSAEAAVRHWDDQLRGCATYSELSLWATDSSAILLIQASGLDAACGLEPGPDEGAVKLQQSGLGVGRTSGEPLFSEQDDPMLVPPNAQTITPTFPISCGTGGSFTVLAASDADAVINALLDAASNYNDEHVVRPTSTTVDGVTATTGSFAIWAGGWLFDVVAVRGPGDPAATVYVRSCAD